MTISEQLLGTREIVILHHKDCGMLTFKHQDVYAKVEETLGADASDVDFLPFPTVYDVKTGRVREVE